MAKKLESDEQGELAEAVLRRATRVTTTSGGRDELLLTAEWEGFDANLRNAQNEHASCHVNGVDLGRGEVAISRLRAILVKTPLPIVLRMVYPGQDTFVGHSGIPWSPLASPTNRTWVNEMRRQKKLRIVYDTPIGSPSLDIDMGIP